VSLLKRFSRSWNQRWRSQSDGVGNLANSIEPEPLKGFEQTGETYSSTYIIVGHERTKFSRSWVQRSQTRWRAEVHCVRLHLCEFYCVLSYILYCFFLSFTYTAYPSVCMSPVHVYGSCCLIKIKWWWWWWSTFRRRRVDRSFCLYSTQKPETRDNLLCVKHCGRGFLARYMVLYINTGDVRFVNHICTVWTTSVGTALKIVLYSSFGCGN